MYKVKAVCFDDYLTLRFPVVEGLNIETELTNALRERFDLDDNFLELYRIEAMEAQNIRQIEMRETSLIEITTRAMEQLGYDIASIENEVIESVVDSTSKWKTSYYPDVFETLEYFKKRGCRLGLITNTHWPYPEDVRERFCDFDVITISYEHGYVKPHPNIFQDTVDLLGVSPLDCVHVGDDPIADIQGARDAGFKTVFINRKNRGNIISDYEIHHLCELQQIL